MALSITELELQSTDYLPAREVLSSIGGHGNDVYGPACNIYRGGILNGVNLQDVLSDINLEAVNDVLDVATANVES